MPPNPLSNPHGFDMQISKFKKTILGLPPPSQILGTPLFSFTIKEIWKFWRLFEPPPPLKYALAVATPSDLHHSLRLQGGRAFIYHDDIHNAYMYIVQSSFNSTTKSFISLFFMPININPLCLYRATCYKKYQ